MSSTGFYPTTFRQTYTTKLGEAVQSVRQVKGKYFSSSKPLTVFSTDPFPVNPKTWEIVFQSQYELTSGTPTVTSYRP